MIELMRSSDRTLVHSASARLEEVEIFSQIFEDNLGNIGAGGLLDCYRLMVLNDDAEAAVEALEEVGIGRLYRGEEGPDAQ